MAVLIKILITDCIYFTENMASVNPYCLVSEAGVIIHFAEGKIKAQTLFKAGEEARWCHSQTPYPAPSGPSPLSSTHSASHRGAKGHVFSAKDRGSMSSSSANGSHVT
jgi:hypothetical protein